MLDGCWMDAGWRMGWDGMGWDGMFDDILAVLPLAEILIPQSRDTNLSRR